MSAAASATGLIQHATKSSSSSLKSVQTLRGILRHMKPPVRSMDDLSLGEDPSSSSSSSLTNAQKDGQMETTHTLRQSVLHLYRQPSQSQQNNSNKMAIDYYSLRKDLRERARLHALDGGAEVKLSPKEMSRRAAARAGLQLPS